MNFTGILTAWTRRSRFWMAVFLLNKKSTICLSTWLQTKLSSFSLSNLPCSTSVFQKVKSLFLSADFFRKFQFCWDQTNWVPPYLHVTIEINTSNIQVQRSILQNCPALRVTIFQTPWVTIKQLPESLRLELPESPSSTPRVTEPQSLLVVSTNKSLSESVNHFLRLLGLILGWNLPSITLPWCVAQYCGPLLNVSVFKFHKDCILFFVDPMWAVGSHAILLHTGVDHQWTVTNFPHCIFTRSDSPTTRVANYSLWLVSEKLWRYEKLNSFLVEGPNLSSAF